MPLMTLTRLAALAFIVLSNSSYAGLMLSEKKAAKIGKETFGKVTSEMPISQNTKLNNYVESIGKKLVTHSDRPSMKFTFTVLDSPEINAFATPGAYVYINRGLITYLKSEAQLASVLAHEIAHVTARHAARQQRAQSTSNFAAGVLAILSRSGEVGEATALWGAATVRGYGREMELEADGLGAKFLAQAGYDHQAMIEVISLLKDNERFEKKRAKDSGKKVQTYHGLFATHPRNDKRLQKIVSAGKDNNLQGEIGLIPFRLAIDKVIWGENFEAKLKKKNRYYNEQLRFRFDYPDGWSFTDSGSVLTGKPKSTEGQITLTIKNRTLQTPEQFIKSTIKIPFIKKSQSFKQAGLIGHTGLIPQQTTADSRLAVIYYGRYAFVFIGKIINSNHEKELNQAFLNMIQSFAPLSIKQLSNRKPERIHYVKARANTTFSALAKYLKLGAHGEEKLRLINGFYPRGEPSDGEWIKIIR